MPFGRTVMPFGRPVLPSVSPSLVGVGVAETLLRFVGLGSNPIIAKALLLRHQGIPFPSLQALSLVGGEGLGGSRSSSKTPRTIIDIQLTVCKLGAL